MTSLTIGLPVSDLERATRWYQEVFALADPDLTPAPGVLEFHLGPVWLQLTAGSAASPTAGPITRFGIADAAAERHRLASLGVPVGPLEHVEAAVDYFDFTDPDGNRLSLYSETPVA